jgi:hypothetical protein
MKLSTLMVINAIIAFIFGVAFVIIPWQMLLLYGVQPSPELNYMGQLFGGALLAFAVLTWSARNADVSEARKSIVMAMFIGDGIGFIVALIGQLNNVVNDFGWSTVVLYLLLAIGFGYFTFSKSSS